MHLFRGILSVIMNSLGDEEKFTSAFKRVHAITRQQVMKHYGQRVWILKHLSCLFLYFPTLVISLVWRCYE